MKSAKTLSSSCRIQLGTDKIELCYTTQAWT